MKRKPQFHRVDGGQIDIRAPGRQDHTVVEEVHVWYETEVHHHHEEAKHFHHGEAPRIEIDKEPTRVRVQGGAPTSQQHRIAGGGETYRGQLRDADYEELPPSRQAPQHSLPRYEEEPLAIPAPRSEVYREPARTARHEEPQQQRRPLPAPEPRQRELPAPARQPALPDHSQQQARRLPPPPPVGGRQMPAPPTRQTQQPPALPAPAKSNSWGSVLFGPSKPRSR